MGRDKWLHHPFTSATASPFLWQQKWWWGGEVIPFPMSPTLPATNAPQNPWLKSCLSIYCYDWNNYKSKGGESNLEKNNTNVAEDLDMRVRQVLSTQSWLMVGQQGALKTNKKHTWFAIAFLCRSFLHGTYQPYLACDSWWDRAILCHFLFQSFGYKMLINKNKEWLSLWTTFMFCQCKLMQCLSNICSDTTPKWKWMVL